MWLDKRRADGRTARTLPFAHAFAADEELAATDIAKHYRSFKARKEVRRVQRFKSVGIVTDEAAEADRTPLRAPRSAGPDRPAVDRAPAAHPRASVGGPSRGAALGMGLSVDVLTGGKKYRGLYDDHIQDLREELKLLNTAIRLEEMEDAGIAGASGRSVYYEYGHA